MEEQGAQRGQRSPEKDEQISLRGGVTIRYVANDFSPLAALEKLYMQFHKPETIVGILQSKCTLTGRARIQ